MPLELKIFKTSLSSNHTIETVIHVDQRKNQNYCYKIAKLQMDTLSQNLITYFCLGISNTTNNMSLKESFVIF